MRKANGTALVALSGLVLGLGLGLGLGLVLGLRLALALRLGLGLGLVLGLGLGLEVVLGLGCVLGLRLDLGLIFGLALGLVTPMIYADAKRRARKEFGLNGHVWTTPASKILPRQYHVGTFITQGGKKTLATIGVGSSWEAAFASAATWKEPYPGWRELP